MTGEELKRRREALGMTQKELAKRLGVTSMTLYRYESAKKIPPMVELSIREIERQEK